MFTLFKVYWLLWSEWEKLFHIKLRKVACRVDVGCVWEYVCLSFYSSNVCLSKVTRASVSSARHWLLYRIIGHGWFILLGHLDDVQGFFRTKFFYLLPFFPSSLQIYEWKNEWKILMSDCTHLLLVMEILDL